ncbi:hypothetical protein [Paraburkholderia sediminicola]|uniref:hypothetical protein n=1 Tax=Paraburkholderia sediminicola TaxID=458836 RepID=UPI0038B73128
MNITEAINTILRPRDNTILKPHDSQLNVLISKDDLLEFKAYAKANGTDASKLTRAFIKAILIREAE